MAIYEYNGKKGTHLGNSQRTKGAKSSNVYDDKTNTLVDNADLIELSEEELRQRYTTYIEIPSNDNNEYNKLSPEMEQAAQELADVTVELLVLLVEKKVVPFVKEKFNNNVKPWVIKKYNKIFHKNSEVVIKNESLVNKVEDSYKRYAKDMTSEEAQRKMLETYILMCKVLENMRELSQSRIIINSDNGEKLIADGKEIVDKLCSQESIDSINYILENNKELLDEKYHQLSSIVNRELVIDGRFQPIEAKEIIKK